MKGNYEQPEILVLLLDGKVLLQASGEPSGLDNCNLDSFEIGGFETLVDAGGN